MLVVGGASLVLVGFLFPDEPNVSPSPRTDARAKLDTIGQCGDGEADEPARALDAVGQCALDDVEGTLADEPARVNLDAIGQCGVEKARAREGTARVKINAVGQCGMDDHEAGARADHAPQELAHVVSFNTGAQCTRMPRELAALLAAN